MDKSAGLRPGVPPHVVIFQFIVVAKFFVILVVEFVVVFEFVVVEFVVPDQFIVVGNRLRDGATDAAEAS